MAINTDYLSKGIPFLAALSLVSYPIAVHISVLLNMQSLRVGALLALIWGTSLLWLIKAPVRTLIVASAVTLAILAVQQRFIFALQYILPVAMPAVLLVIFGRTLLPGKTPLITAIGEAARGPLSNNMRKYTAGLTAFWCAMFAGMISGPLIALALGSHVTWSWLTNVANTVGVASVFCLEFLLRKRLFPTHNHPRFGEYIKIILQSDVYR